MASKPTSITARYMVMTLLYEGKIREAEQALNDLVATGAINPVTEAGYRDLLTRATQFEAHKDARAQKASQSQAP